jgi:alternate signal-mediated exported protein
MPKQLKFTLVAAVVLALFLGAQGTAAVWRAERNIDAGTMRTGNLLLLVGAEPKEAANYEFIELDGSNLVPGQYVQAPLMLSNGGTTDLLYNLVGASAKPETPTDADTALADSSILSIYAGMTAVACDGRQALSGQMLYKGTANSTAKFAVARPLLSENGDASKENLCVRLSVPSNAPQAASGGSLKLVLNFVGQQQ